MTTLELKKSAGLYDSIIQEFINLYNETRLPIEVNFRELNKDLNNSDRSTHLIHTYPAKLLPHIPYIFLNNNLFSKEGDVVLDPFCGSGTVLLEAMLAGRNSIGVDANPLARLISKVKTSRYDTEHLKIILRQLKASYNTSEGKSIPNVINIDHWFLKSTQESLGRLYHLVAELEETSVREFFLLCFSNCVKKVSLADPRVSVPVKLRYDRFKIGHPLRKENKKRLESLKEINVLDKFVKISEENIKRFEALNVDGGTSSDIIGKDARFISKSLLEEGLPREDNSVDLVITSPPYGGAQKYIRSSSLNLGWIGELENRSLRSYEKESIGREHYNVSEYQELSKTGIEHADEILAEVYKINPLRAHISSNYLIEMRQSLKEIYRVLKQGSFLVLVAANNQVCGKNFETQFFLKKICLDIGFSVHLELVDDIKSYGLMTKRNKTASIITREWVLVLKK